MASQNTTLDVHWFMQVLIDQANNILYICVYNQCKLTLPTRFRCTNNAALGKPVVVSIAVKLIFNVFDLVNYQMCHIICTAHIIKQHIHVLAPVIIACFKKVPDSI